MPKKKKKIRQKIDGFSDNLIEVDHGKFSLLIREYSLLAVNVFSSSFKISDFNKNNFLKLNFTLKGEGVG